MYNIIMCDDDAGYIKELVSLIHRSNDGKREVFRRVAENRNW